MKPEIALTTAIYVPAMAAFEREYTLHKLFAAPERAAFVEGIGARIRAVVTNTLAGLPRSEMDAMPNLELIACFGRSFGPLDVAEAKRRGIAMTTVPVSIAPEVGELAVGLLLSAARRIAESDRYVRAGKWEAAPFQMGRAVAGLRCGILGLGEVGMEFAKRAAPLVKSLAYCDIAAKADVPYRYYSDLETMARECDCIVVAAKLNPATRHIVNARILEALGADGFLINVSRGPVVDQEALIAALREKRIAGAGLDVFTEEPYVPPELRALDNVVMTAHIGSATREVREERMKNVLANLQAHFSGQPLLTPLA